MDYYRQQLPCSDLVLNTSIYLSGIKGNFTTGGYESKNSTLIPMSSAPTVNEERAQIDLVYKFSGEDILILAYGFKFTVDNIFFKGDPYERSMHLDFSSTIFNNVISFGYLHPNDLPKTNSTIFKDVQSFYEEVVVETRATFCTDF